VCYDASAGWSSLVARRAHNPKVVSSNLTPATNFSSFENGLEDAPSKPFRFSVQLARSDLATGHTVSSCVRPLTGSETSECVDTLAWPP
jgi:hypothetical protein